MLTKDLDRSRVFVGGVAAGLVGGVTLSLIGALVALGAGHDVWMGLKGAGVPFLGDRALTPGFDALAVLVGLVTHLAVSVAWGIPFAFLADGLTRFSTLAFGMLWGFLVWIGMHHIVLPVLGLGHLVRGAPAAFSVFMHLVFGLAVAVGFLPFQRPHPTRPVAGAH